MNSALVTIVCPVFNHEKFIRQALDSFLMQKTTFKFEILIHDDASTDNTPKIIREYETQYPEIIKPIFQIINQHSKGIKNAEIIFPLIKSKYIALCEGDDYWIDPFKLQKQADYLERNTNCSGVYTNYKFNVDGSIIENKGLDMNCLDDKCQIVKVWRGNYLISQTATVFFRSDIIKSSLTINNCVKVKKLTIAFDNLTQLAIFNNGWVGYLNEPMSVYRVHSEGVSRGREFNYVFELSKLAFILRNTSSPLLRSKVNLMFTKVFDQYFVLNDRNPFKTCKMINYKYDFLFLWFKNRIIQKFNSMFNLDFG